MLQVSCELRGILHAVAFRCAERLRCSNDHHPFTTWSPRNRNVSFPAEAVIVEMKAKVTSVRPSTDTERIDDPEIHSFVRVPQERHSKSKPFIEPNCQFGGERHQCK